MHPLKVVRMGLVCAFTLVALLLPWVAAFGSQDSVILKGLSYSPRTIHVNVGDTVAWSDEDSGVTHTVTAHNGAFDSYSGGKYMHADDTFRIYFPVAGTYTYYCRVHGDANNPYCAGMCGVVVVGSPSTPKPAQTSRPATTRQTASSSSSSSSSGGSVTAFSTATVSPSVSPLPSETPSVAASPLAAPPESTPSNRGALLGIAIGGLAVGASSSGLVLYRSRRAKSIRETPQ